jgi:hypothetical protein
LKSDLKGRISTGLSGIYLDSDPKVRTSTRLVITQRPFKEASKNNSRTIKTMGSSLISKREDQQVSLVYTCSQILKSEYQQDTLLNKKHAKMTETAEPSLKLINS